jgi:hypothetical protein
MASNLDVESANQGHLEKAMLKDNENPSLEITLEAYFNPKEISIDQSVGWQEHSGSDGAKKKEQPERNKVLMEFTAAKPKVLKVDLMFDCYEENPPGNVYSTYISKLEELTKVQPTLSRPPTVLFAWGAWEVFKGVIMSANIKYTLFLPNGMPVRATASITINSADDVKLGTKK